MRMATVIAGGLIALVCGIILLYLGVKDAGDGNMRAVLPISMGAVLAVGGLHFLRKGFLR